MALPAEMVAETQEIITFKQWLGGLCSRAGISASRLQRMLVRRGYDCTSESVRRWIRGDSVPSADAIRPLLGALGEVLPEEDVHASFKRFAQMSYFDKNSQEAV